MKKLIVLPMIMAVLLLVAAPAHAQSPANDLKPTFISPTPGLYVNGWPAFTVSYPKEWVEVPVPFYQLFGAGAPRANLSPSPSFYITVVSSVLPLEDWAKSMMPFYAMIGTDIKILSDKASQLKDGTPAREVQLEYVSKGSQGMGAGLKQNDFHLMTNKDTSCVDVSLSTGEEKAGEDVKRIAYSLTFQPDREKPVQVPPDVRAFLDMHCTDNVSGDIKLILEHFSDRFRHSGISRADFEQWLRNDPLSPVRRRLISFEPIVTVFEPRGDKAYVDGFFLQKAKDDTNAVKIQMSFQQIINEHGEWKWFGNQK
jgi:hypothetical protein